MKRLLITVVAVMGLSLPTKADVNTDLNCLAALSKVRDHLIDIHGAHYNGSAQKDQALILFTEVQEKIFLKYPIGHRVINTVNMDRVVARLFSDRDILVEAAKATSGIIDFCGAYGLPISRR